jgi:hypothetical protein
MIDKLHEQKDIEIQSQNLCTMKLLQMNTWKIAIEFQKNFGF